MNIDHVATVRQQRRGRCPDPVQAARVCERAGAGSIVCHLREDRRHIQDADVRRLRRAVRTQLNLEMSIAPDVVGVALAVRPDQATLVPERRVELTTEGGLDVRRRGKALARVVRRLQGRGIRVSLFIDPLPAQVRAAAAVGTRMIELHTGPYADATSARQRHQHLARLRGAAMLGRSLGLQVAAGHGLDYENVGAVARLPGMDELNIGYSIVCRALEVGLAQAVREMVARIGGSR